LTNKRIDQLTINKSSIQQSTISNPVHFVMLFKKFNMHAINRDNAFTYITALIFVIVIGISLTTGSAYWSTIIAREKEKELLFRGDQIRKAIEAYYNGAPGGGSKLYPASLSDLLKDSRYLATRRYLRKIYRDPMAKDGQWGLIKAPDGKIKGVCSTSKESPIKKGNFPQDYVIFEKAGSYSDWRFIYPLEIENAASSNQASQGTETGASSQKSVESVQEEQRQKVEEPAQEQD
jgi:type II secretory pathway pseudopilin PulG